MGEFVGKRRRSKVAVYYHFVWATKEREPWMTVDVEAQVTECVNAVVQNAGGTVIAIGGMPDHLHVLVRSAAGLSPAALAQLMKGSSSATVNANLGNDERRRYWQPGYGCFSLSRSHVDRAAEYVRNQKLHHRENSLLPAWEETDEEAP